MDLEHNLNLPSAFLIPLSKEVALTAQSLNCFSPCSNNSSVKRGLFLRREEEVRWKDGGCLGEDARERAARPDAISSEAERRIRRRVAEERGGWRAWIASFIIV